MTQREFIRRLRYLGHQIENCELDDNEYVPHYWCRNCRNVFYTRQDWSFICCKKDEYQSIKEFVRLLKEDFIARRITGIIYDQKHCTEIIIEAIIK